MPQTIAVLDFGSQLTQVIARRIRECQVYTKIYHFSTPAATLRAENVVGKAIFVFWPPARIGLVDKKSKEIQHPERQNPIAVPAY